MTEPIQQSPAQVAPPQQQPGFSLNDLRAMQQIIAIASQRGAFKAEEMSSIGMVYDRLLAFLAASDAATQAAQGPTGAVV